MSNYFAIWVWKLMEIFPSIMEKFPKFEKMSVMSTAAARKMNPGNLLSKYEKLFDNNITLLVSAKKGLKPDAVFDFILVSKKTSGDVETLLNKTIKTFNNYKENNTLLDPAISEKLLKLFSLYSKGLSVFGSAEEFNAWMSEPAFGLGNKLPETFLDTITGIELVAEELTRIEYGDLA